MVPLVPGATVQGMLGRWAVVQPQPGWTLLMITSLAETLVKLKNNSPVLSPSCASMDFSSESQVMTVAGRGPLNAGGGTATGALATTGGVSGAVGATTKGARGTGWSVVTALWLKQVVLMLANTTADHRKKWLVFIFLFTLNDAPWFDELKMAGLARAGFPKRP